MKNRLIFSPFLLTIFPILFLLSVNQKEAMFSQVITPLIFALLMTAMVFYLINLAVKNVLKSSLITSLGVIFFFSYGRIHLYVLNKKILGITLANHLILLSLLAIIVALLVYLTVKTRRNLTTLGGLLLVVSASLVAITLYNVVYYELTSRSKLSQEKTTEASDGANKDIAKADVYQIILDGYASDNALRDLYGFDNQEFLNSLKDKGFFVNEKSTSNYTLTFLSLSSALNMNYMDQFKIEEGKKYIDRAGLFTLMDKNEIASKMKSYGYEFIQIGSGWEGTDKSSLADINYSTPYMN